MSSIVSEGCLGGLNAEWHAYQLEEYKSLREEIARHDQSRRVTESSIAVGLVVSYGWMLENVVENSFSEHYLYYLPLLLVFAGAFRELGFRVRAMQIAEYLCGVEDYYRNYSMEGAPCGWETHLTVVRKEFKNKALRNSVVLFWCLLLVGSLWLSEYLIVKSNGVGLVNRLINSVGNSI